jgi:hypothetical protein
MDRKVTKKALFILVSVIPITLLLLFASCGQKEEAAEEENPSPHTGPSIELQIAIENLAVLGFVPAPKVVRHDYPYHSHLITIESQPYFIVDAREHWFLGRNEQYAEAFENGEIGKVKNVWAYYVKKDDAEGTMPDAIIEEWEYETPKTAYDAFKQMGSILASKYIKEPSYSLQHDNRIYLLYSRAQAFQKDLDTVYEMLKAHL